MKYRPQLNTAAHNKQHICSPTNRTFQGKVLTVHLHLQQCAKGAASTAAVTHPWALAAFVHLALNAPSTHPQIEGPAEVPQPQDCIMYIALANP